jgi:hypothetical protein
MSFGKGILNAIGWGSIYKKSNSGETETELTNQQEKNKEDDNKD